MEKYGQERVENFIDKALSIENLLDINHLFETSEVLESRKLKNELAAKEDDNDGYVFDDRSAALKSFMRGQKKIKPEVELPEEIVAEKNVSKGERDIMRFLIREAPIEEWEADILGCLREEAYYFLPQRITKIMNEGWASYWHSTIMTKNALRAEEIIDFCDHHAGVMVMSKKNINPYKIGIELYRDIEFRWNTGKFGKEYNECDSLEEKENWNQMKSFLFQVFLLEEMKNQIEKQSLCDQNEWEKKIGFDDNFSWQQEDSLLFDLTINHHQNIQLNNNNTSTSTTTSNNTTTTTTSNYNTTSTNDNNNNNENENDNNNNDKKEKNNKNIDKKECLNKNENKFNYMLKLQKFFNCMIECENELINCIEDFIDFALQFIKRFCKSQLMNKKCKNDENLLKFQQEGKKLSNKQLYSQFKQMIQNKSILKNTIQFKTKLKKQIQFSNQQQQQTEEQQEKKEEEISIKSSLNNNKKNFNNFIEFKDLILSKLKISDNGGEIQKSLIYDFSSIFDFLNRQTRNEHYFYFDLINNFQLCHKLNLILNFMNSFDEILSLPIVVNHNSGIQNKIENCREKLNDIKLKQINNIDELIQFIYNKSIMKK
jgi:hypothetical protein